jgi:peptidyl-prolyl cis-trans isomerase A (cyclophilin A)
MAPKKQKKPIPQKQQKRNSNKTTWMAIGAIAIVVIIFGALAASGMLGNNSGSTNPTATPSPIASTKVLLQTTAGNITIDLRTDKPITSTNFINLVKAGKYDGSNFSRVVSGFMIQGGKVSGTVATIPDEIGSNNRNTQYTIAMAKTSEPNSATSEFFINVADNGQANQQSDFDGTYTVFGNVIAGKDIVDAIANAPAVLNPNMPWTEYSLPVNPVTIIHASIVP